jgi:hypothetical protein
MMNVFLSCFNLVNVLLSRGPTAGICDEHLSHVDAQSGRVQILATYPFLQTVGKCDTHRRDFPCLCTYQVETSCYIPMTHLHMTSKQVTCVWTVSIMWCVE